MHGSGLILWLSEALYTLVNEFRVSVGCGISYLFVSTVGCISLSNILLYMHLAMLYNNFCC